MVIKELSTKNFRNLEEFKILLSPKLNVIYGDNGSGKTSLLESLHLYWNGKSFRSSSLNDLVASGENDLTLYGKAVLDEVEVPFGVTFDKSTRKRTVKLDGTTIKKSSQLAQLLPTYYFSPSSSYYGSASPGTRRELLFWFMFHVEQQFRSLYGEYKKALSSRNSLLREIKKSGHLTFSNSNLVLSKDFDLQLDFWEQKLAQFNFELYENTKFHLEKFNVLIGSLLPDETPSFLKFDEIKLTKQGLDKITFAEQLKNLRANDIRQGYTSIGFQKIDLFFYKNKKKITGQ